MQSIRKKSFAAEQLAKRQKKSPATIAIIVLAVVIAVGAVGYALYVRFGAKEEPTEAVAPAETIKSIAVLPFVNMSADPEQEYFCDGLTDALINALTKVEDLRVIPRTSTFVFKGKYEDVRVIGDSLDVDSVLEGSVVKSDDRIRVTTQLIKIADNSHLFSDSYDYVMTDLLKLQDDITFDVINALRVTLVEREIDAIRNRYTNNTKAYDLYLKGFFHWRNRSTEEFKIALNLYQQAIDIDPNYALAYAGIADVYNLMGLHGDIHAKDAFPQAKIWAQKALQIDENLAEAYNSLAYATFYLDWDWDEAERLFKKALELNPYYALAHWWYKDYLLAMGRGIEAREDLKESIKLDPLNGQLYSGLFVTLFSMGRCDEIWEQIQRRIKKYPEYTDNYQKGRYYICMKNYKKAIESWQFLQNTRGMNLLGYAYAKAGKDDEARQILEKVMKEKYKGTMSYELKIASLYTGLGEYDNAFGILEKAYEEHVYDLPCITLWPFFDDLRSDPRYKALLEKMNLPLN